METSKAADVTQKWDDAIQMLWVAKHVRDFKSIMVALIERPKLFEYLVVNLTEKEVVEYTNIVSTLYAKLARMKDFIVKE